MPKQKHSITNNAIFYWYLAGYLKFKKDEEYTKLYVDVPNSEEISQVAEGKNL